MWAKLRRRFRYWRERDARASQLREEMEAHIALAADDSMPEGVSREHAVARARRRFGNTTGLAERSREIWTLPWLEDLLGDLRYAARNLRRDPGFTAAAALSATLAVAACTTIYGVVNFALFRPLPVTAPDQLLFLSAANAKKSGMTMSYPEIERMRESPTQFAGIAAYSNHQSGTIAPIDGEARRHWGTLADANYFDVVQPGFHLGRGFDARTDGRPGAPRSIVLTYRTWQDRFGADPSLIGKSILIDGKAATVTGVTAPGFRGTDVIMYTEFWIPMSMVEHVDPLNPPAARERLTNPHSQWLHAVARLAPGATLDTARSELERVAFRGRQESSQWPAGRGYLAEVAGRLHPGVRQLASLFFALVVAVTVLVLLIACANVGNLLLARGEVRQREMATRLAIGAGRGRLVRQLLAESVLLAALGGLPGLAIAAWCGQSLGSLRLPVPMPIDFTVAIDYRVGVFCFVMCLVTGVLFGLVPSIRVSRTPLVSGLKAEPHATGIRRFSLRNTLVVAQVAISLLLLVGSALFLRSLVASQTANTGIRNRNIAMVAFDPALQNRNTEASVATARAVLAAVEGIPGVLGAALTDSVPLNLGGVSDAIISADKRTEWAKYRISADIYSISPSYFETLGIPLLYGRAGGSAGEVVVNEHLAARLAAGRSAIGERILHNGKEQVVVGIAKNTMSRTIGDEERPVMYLSLLQSLSTGSGFGMTLLVHTQGPPQRMLDPVQQSIRRVVPGLALFDMRTFEDHLQKALFFPRLAALLFGVCGAAGLLIAAIGVYGVISYSVSRRSREIGIRMALGAEQRQVMTMVLRQGLWLTALGIAIGLLGGVAFGRAAQSLLYGVAALDSFTFLGVPALLLAVAALASAIPARRASAVDPNVALRYE